MLTNQKDWRDKMEKRGICFEIQGECAAKGRPKFCKWGVYTPEKTKDYEKKVKEEFEQQYPDFIPFSSRIKANIIITKKVLKSSSKKDKIKMLSGEISPITRPDLDNYIKSILDGLNKIAFVDDSIIAKISAEKKYGNESKVEVLLEEF
jgi:Holliday junction resolvase RusA-like endonuclease